MGYSQAEPHGLSHSNGQASSAGTDSRHELVGRRSTQGGKLGYIHRDSMAT